MPLLPPDPNADPRTQSNRERAEFARIAADLDFKSGAGHAAFARGVQSVRLWQLERLPREEVAALVDDLWREEERRRQRRAPFLHAAIALGVALFAAACALDELKWTDAYVADQYAWSKVASRTQAAGIILAAGAFYLTGATRRQKGMLRLLPLYRDARLTGAYLDALRFWNTPDRPAALRSDLTDLLPRLATADAAPLEPRQWRILAKEIRRVLAYARWSRKPLSRADAAFVCAALDALGHEAGRPAAGAPARDTAERVAERVRRAVPATLPGAGADTPHWADVREAAEECWVRARL